jgi:hypothetical protein
MSFVDVRDPYTKKLLFRYDPVRNLVEIQERKVRRIVDLCQYQSGLKSVKNAVIVEQTTEQPQGTESVFKNAMSERS